MLSAAHAAGYVSRSDGTLRAPDGVPEAGTAARQGKRGHLRERLSAGIRPISFFLDIRDIIGYFLVAYRAGIYQCEPLRRVSGDGRSP